MLISVVFFTQVEREVYESINLAVDGSYCLLETLRGYTKFNSENEKGKHQC